MAENANKQKKVSSKLYTIAVMLIALLCSVMLWLYVLGYDSPDFEKKFSQIPVSVIGVAELNESTGYTVISDVEFSFDVTVSGKKTDVNSMRETDITAYVDVSSVSTEGGIYLPVTVIVPNGITVKAQSVSSAYLFIDEMVTAEIPVRIEIADYSLPENMTIGDFAVSPTTVTVQGPKAEVEKIKEAYARVSPGAITGSIFTSASVELRGFDGSEIIPGAYMRQIDSTVNITIPVYATKTLPVRVQFVGGIFGTENAVITTSVTHINVKGTASSLAAIDEVLFSIDETTLETYSTIYKRVILPDGVENVSGVDTVEVNIQLNQMGHRTVPADNTVFELINVPEGADVQIITPSLNIDFAGPIDFLRYFDSSFFTVVVDLEGIAVESGDSFFVAVEVRLKTEQPGVYVSGDYSVNVVVN